jgi:hypothetical protein
MIAINKPEDLRGRAQEIITLLREANTLYTQQRKGEAQTLARLVHEKSTSLNDDYERQVSTFGDAHPTVRINRDAVHAANIALEHYSRGEPF